MKSIVLASALAAAGLLVGSASGRPLNHKRKLVTEVVYVTETAADVIVYVDQNGSPYSTATTGKTTSVASSVVVPSTTAEVALPTSETQAAWSSATPAPAPSSASSEEPSSTLSASTAEPKVADVLNTTPTATPSSAVAESSSVTSSPSQEPKPAPQPSSAAPDVPAKKTDSGNGLPLGITYDAFASSGTDSRCKSPDEIASDFSRMKDYEVIRIYGMGCDQIPLAVENALKNGQKLMGGAYMDSNGGNGEDLGEVIQAYKDAIDQYAGGSWDVVQLFSVENERVNDHTMTASEVVDAIRRSRDQLRGLGYNGPVGAVETVPATVDNPAICDASDVVMVNSHAFFDRNTKAEDAGTFVKGQVDQVRSACNNKRVVVTESGWPHQGNANGAAVPSPDNQRAAIDSLRANFDHDMFLFSSFDSGWKADSASTFNAERYWGVIQ